MRKLTIIESPYADSEKATMAEHLTYLRQCLRHSWELGELPFASHVFFPFFLNESNINERQMGIEAGYEFWRLFPGNIAYNRKEYPVIAFYCDLGISPGMKLAMERVSKTGNPFVIRNIIGA